MGAIEKPDQIITSPVASGPEGPAGEAWGGNGPQDPVAPRIPLVILEGPNGPAGAGFEMAGPDHPRALARGPEKQAW